MTRRTAHTLRLLLALTAVTLLACSSTGGSLSDEQVSLRPEGLLQVTTPMAPAYPAVEPGGNELLPRAYYGAPPMIPHTVADTLVASDVNDCLDCHAVRDEETPGIPPTHHVRALFTELEPGHARKGSLTAFAGFGKADSVSGTRYDCLLCHAPQTNNAPPLVGNSFQPDFLPGKPADSLDGLKSLGKY